VGPKAFVLAIGSSALEDQYSALNGASGKLWDTTGGRRAHNLRGDLHDVHPSLFWKTERIWRSPVGVFLALAQRAKSAAQAEEKTMSRVPFAVSATGWPCLAVGAQRRGGARSHREHFSRWLAAVLMLAMLGFAREAFAQSWSLTGSINTARIYDTATLLPNGQALVAGGANSSDNYISSAELYNPASGTWSLTGSLNFDRAYHTATLLPNGQVLAAGGFGFVDGSPAIAIPSSAELYNPATGTWSVTGMLNVARYWHTATLL